MVYRFVLMSENPAHVSGRTIFTIKNIVAPSSWLLKVYSVPKSLNLYLSSVVRDVLIHRTIILDLRHCLSIIDCFTGKPAADP